MKSVFTLFLLIGTIVVPGFVYAQITVTATDTVAVSAIVPGTTPIVTTNPTVTGSYVNQNNPNQPQTITTTTVTTTTYLWYPYFPYNIFSNTPAQDQNLIATLNNSLQNTSPSILFPSVNQNPNNLTGPTGPNGPLGPTDLSNTQPDNSLQNPLPNYLDTPVAEATTNRKVCLAQPSTTDKVLGYGSLVWLLGIIYQAVRFVRNGFARKSPIMRLVLRNMLYVVFGAGAAVVGMVMICW